MLMKYRLRRAGLLLFFMVWFGPAAVDADPADEVLAGHWAYEHLDILGRLGLIPKANPLFAQRKSRINRRLAGDFARQSIEKLLREGESRPVPVEACRALRNLLSEFTAEALQVSASPGRKPEIPPAWKSLLRWDGQTILSPDRQIRVIWMPSFAGAHFAILDTKAGKVTHSAVEGCNYSPVWSPDGRSCAYLRFQNGTTEVWVVSRSDWKARKIGENETDAVASLAWEADGKAVRLRLPGESRETTYSSSGDRPRTASGQAS
ncbi:MAG: PD40 domain-containing protein [Armatimonadetes bacterium]|nr:PD40 domain-containing protein [Armatimonadota bacterium]